MMTDPCLAIVTAAGPVATSHVVVARIGGSIGLRASEDVMSIRRVTTAGYGSTTLVDHGESANPIHDGV